MSWLADFTSAFVGGAVGVAADTTTTDEGSRSDTDIAVQYVAKSHFENSGPPSDFKSIPPRPPSPIVPPPVVPPPRPEQ